MNSISMIGFSDNVYALTKSGNNLIAGTDYIEMYDGSFLYKKYTGQVSSLYSNGSIVFSGTTAGQIYYSINNGINWGTSKIVGLDSIDASITSFTMNGNIALAGMEKMGLIESIDSGRTWSIVPNTSMENIKCLLTVGNICFKGIYGNGVYSSTNQGFDWTEKNSGLTNKNILCFAVKGNDIYAGTKGGEIFHSSDLGGNWISIGSNQIKKDISSIAVSDSLIFAGTNGGGIYCSLKSRYLWSYVNSGLKEYVLRDSVITTLLIEDSKFYCGTIARGVYLSDINEIFVHSLSDNKICQGDTMSINFHLKGNFGGGVIFNAILSDKYGSFSDPDTLDIVFDYKDYTIKAFIPQTTSSGKGYLIKIGTMNYRYFAYQNLDSITVFALPQVYKMAGGGTYCEGDSGLIIGLTGSEINMTYQLYQDSNKLGNWILGTGINIDFGLIKEKGIYHVIATNSISGCSSLMKDSVKIKINKLPNQPYITLSKDRLISSYALGNQWYFNGNILLDSTSDMIYPRVTGYYQTQIKEVNTGCFSRISDSVFFTYTDVGENNSKGFYFNIFPNPSSDLVEISNIDFKHRNEFANQNIRISNILGETVFDVQIKYLESLKIDISSFNKGIYFVRIGDRVQKFFKL